MTDLLGQRKVLLTPDFLVLLKRLDTKNATTDRPGQL